MSDPNEIERILKENEKLKMENEQLKEILTTKMELENNISSEGHDEMKNTEPKETDESGKDKQYSNESDPQLITDKIEGIVEHSAEKELYRRPHQLMSTEKNNLTRHILCIFNKLTKINFSVLLPQFLDVINKFAKAVPDFYSYTIMLIVEKAVRDQKFQAIYLRFIERACGENKEFRVSFLDYLQVQFGKIVQEEYQREKLQPIQVKLIEMMDSNDIEKNKLKIMYEEMEYSIRHRSYGIIELIGKCLNDFLTRKILWTCVFQLIDSNIENKWDYTARLLKIVGKDLSRDDCYNKMEKVINDIKNVLKDENLKMPSRIRFQLLDLFELYDNNWNPIYESHDPDLFILSCKSDAYGRNLKREKLSMKEIKEIGKLYEPI